MQRGLLGAIGLGCLLSIWGAIYPQNTWLQVGPVALAIPFAICALRRWPISNGSAVCLAAFVLLHLFAARWSYSFVPYNEGLKAVSGFDLDQVMGFRRDMFDRLVHFLFGVLMMPPMAEVAMRYAGARRGFAILFAVLFVLGVSSLYEIFEWALTMTLSPGDAGFYNGEQGDPFDSQKDMACAAVGALAMVPLLLWRGRLGKG